MPWRHLASLSLGFLIYKISLLDSIIVSQAGVCRPLCIYGLFSKIPRFSSMKNIRLDHFNGLASSKILREKIVFFPSPRVGEIPSVPRVGTKVTHLFYFSVFLLPFLHMVTLLFWISRAVFSIKMHLIKNFLVATLLKVKKKLKRWSWS